MEKILVTGGAGYIGSILVPRLLNLGYQVTVLDNFMYSQASLLNVCHYDNFEVINGDCRNLPLLKKVLIDKDYIIPLAAIVGAPACDKDPIRSRSTNFEAIEKIVSMISKDQKIIFPVTNSGYGIGEANKYCDENSPLKPISHYGIDKVEAEKIILERENSVCFRLATVFGASPRMRLDLLVNEFVYRAVTDRFIVLFEPHFKRNYIHVNDVANAFIFAINNFNKMKGQTYNHGLNEANFSKMELCQIIKKFVPELNIYISPDGKDPDQRNYIVSNDKLASCGFKNQHTLESGIIELIKAYRIIRKFGFDNL